MLLLFGGGQSLLKITDSRGYRLGQKIEVTKMDCFWQKLGISQTGGRYHDSLLLDGISSF